MQKKKQPPEAQAQPRASGGYIHNMQKPELGFNQKQVILGGKSELFIAYG
jgi:hypothetical protein